LKKPLEIKGGMIAVPNGPGLGVELDPEKLEELTKTDVRESVFFDSVEDENMPLIGQVL
jgi:hypothetical protein